MDTSKEILNDIIESDPHHDMHFDSKEAQMFVYIQMLAKVMLELMERLDLDDDCDATDIDINP